MLFFYINLFFHPITFLPMTEISRKAMHQGVLPRGSWEKTTGKTSEPKKPQQQTPDGGGECRSTKNAQE
jgi:hypothetical protein